MTPDIQNEKEETTMLSSKVRSRLDWLLPFIISFGMGFGALCGIASVSDAASQEGPAGDIAGAAGALVVAICVGAGFVMATLTLIVTKVLRRGPPQRIALRIVLSVVGGGIIGALVISSQTGPTTESSQTVPTAAAWVLLFGLPVLSMWAWRAKRERPPQEPQGTDEPDGELE